MFLLDIRAGKQMGSSRESKWGKGVLGGKQMLVSLDFEIVSALVLGVLREVDSENARWMSSISPLFFTVTTRKMTPYNTSI